MKLCSFPDCGRKLSAKGLCSGHRKQQKSGRELSPLKQLRRYGVALERDAVGRKQCSRCLEWLDEAEFQKLSTRIARDGLSRECRTCKKYSLIKTNYGLSRDEYATLLDAQNGGCYICGVAEDYGKALCVDHDHNCCPGEKSCGRCVRKLLCNRHNLLLGHARDSRDELLRLVEYLEEHQSPLTGELGSPEEVV